jgi:hypothetical protein
MRLSSPMQIAIGERNHQDDNHVIAVKTAEDTRMIDKNDRHTHSHSRASDTKCAWPCFFDTENHFISDKKIETIRNLTAMWRQV